MRECLKFYVDGQWVDPSSTDTLDVIDPATEQVVGVVALGSSPDVHKAVQAARRAFDTFSRTSREERVDLLSRIKSVAEARLADLSRAITMDIGAPVWLADEMQAPLALVHLQSAIDVLKNFEFEEQQGTTLIVREPIGVCGLITPWNWPINQIAAKVAPALACGCTMVLKPSEVAPFSAQVWAEILDESAVPAGVFNMIHGVGKEVGEAITSHPDVDMVSFTGSTRAGIEVARSAAGTVKRVTQELGGKSANIVLPDADLSRVVPAAVLGVMVNTGQTCSALTRLLVPSELMLQAVEIARRSAEKLSVGPPRSGAQIGPLASQAQFEKVQRLIRCGIEGGAELVAGGTGRPEGLQSGFYARPTIFSDVTPDMAIASEEIFGPVLVIMAYDDIDEAVRIANDTPYGLAAGVQGEDLQRAESVARRLRAGQIMMNNAEVDFSAPFGGYKQSGNGREWGEYGFADFLEIKAVIGGGAHGK